MLVTASTVTAGNIHMSLPWNQPSKRHTRESYYIPYTCSERRCRTNYHSRKSHRHCRYMCVQHFSVAERVVGTVVSHRTRQQSMNPREYGCTWSRNHSRTAVHPQFEWERYHNLPKLHRKEDLDCEQHANRHTGIGGFRRWRPRSLTYLS